MVLVVRLLGLQNGIHSIKIVPRVGLITFILKAKATLSGNLVMNAILVLLPYGNCLKLLSVAEIISSKRSIIHSIGPLRGMQRRMISVDNFFLFLG